MILLKKLWGKGGVVTNNNYDSLGRSNYLVFKDMKPVKMKELNLNDSKYQIQIS